MQKNVSDKIQHLFINKSAQEITADNFNLRDGKRKNLYLLNIIRRGNVNTTSPKSVIIKCSFSPSLYNIVLASLVKCKEARKKEMKGQGRKQIY